MLDTSHVNCQMSLIYITNEFLKKFQGMVEEEKFLTTMKYKELL